MSFDAELRDCLEVVLGERPPEPEGDALLFTKQWLAERNLGLVPIADPAAFAWPGHWLARAGEHAVVMFGSPSGPLHDPAGALTNGAAVDEGWVVARLDVHLPIESPYGVDAHTGAVAGLLVAPDAEAQLVPVDSVAAVPGRGLEGDRYYEGRGTFSGGGRGYELTLVESEVLDELGLPWPDARRNVVTRGVELNALVGKRFTIGEVECIGRRLAEPCAHLEKVSGAGLMRPLVHRAGLRADILRGGTITVGDRVE
ncbi:MAG TPA: MOSC domain-containing protein [Gaiellaceae bacterium]|nr:MOSC domain-containing protein [Gaiellaceae bacterium]